MLDLMKSRKFWEGSSEVAQSCPTLCDPMDCSPPGSLVHGIFQAWILEWVAISFSRGSSLPRDRTQVSRVVGRRFTIWATREAQVLYNISTFLRKWRPIETGWLNLSVFMLDLMKSRKFWEGAMTRQRVWGRCSEWTGKTQQGLSTQIYLCVPVSLEIGMTLLSEYREGFIICFRGRSRSPSCTCKFSNSFSLKY